jgi:glutamyl-tRNA synthetase
MLVPKGMDRPTAASLLAEATSIVTAAPAFEHAALEADLRALASSRNVKTGQLFMTLRVASTFSNVSPPLFETMEALGRDRVVQRLETAQARLGG